MSGWAASVVGAKSCLCSEAMPHLAPCPKHQEFVLELVPDVSYPFEVFAVDSGAVQLPKTGQRIWNVDEGVTTVDGLDFVNVSKAVDLGEWDSVVDQAFDAYSDDIFERIGWVLSLRRSQFVAISNQHAIAGLQEINRQLTEEGT